jgi:hypothetical protein
MADDTFMPAEKVVTFMRRLSWRYNRRGSLVTNILDTTHPEGLTIVEDPQHPGTWRLVIYRVGELNSTQTLATGDSETELMEYAREMVGDPLPIPPPQPFVERPYPGRR